jgi:hypothetical protein
MSGSIETILLGINKPEDIQASLLQGFKDVKTGRKKGLRLLLNHNEERHGVAGLTEEIGDPTRIRRRFTGGGTFYHLQTSEGYNPTGCYTLILPDKNVSARKDWGDHVIETIHNNHGVSNDQHVFYEGDDLYVDIDGSRKQVAGLSGGLFGDVRMHRACWYETGFEDALRDSTSFLQGDGEDVGAFYTKVQPVKIPLVEYLGEVYGATHMDASNYASPEMYASDKEFQSGLEGRIKIGREFGFRAPTRLRPRKSCLTGAHLSPLDNNPSTF